MPRLSRLVGQLRQDANCEDEAGAVVDPSLPRVDTLPGAVAGAVFVATQNESPGRMSPGTPPSLVAKEPTVMLLTLISP
jgi:hypothetical protein